MTFSLSLYSGWSVKILFKDGFFPFIGADIFTACCFAHRSSCMKRRMTPLCSSSVACDNPELAATGLALTLLPGITFLAQEKGFPGESFHCLPIIPHRKDWWTGRGISAKQMKICNSGALAERQLQATWSQREAGPCLLHR